MIAHHNALPKQMVQPLYIYLNVCNHKRARGGGGGRFAKSTTKNQPVEVYPRRIAQRDA